MEEKEVETAEIYSQRKTRCWSGKTKTETVFSSAQVRTTEDARLYFEKEDALKTAINQVYGSKSEKAVTPSTVQQKNSDTRKEFLRVFGRLTTRHRAWDVWRDFVVMFACSLSNPVDKSHYDEREKRYLKIINKYNREEQQLFPELAAHTVMALEENPEQDFLGGIFMELGLGDGKNGQFFTPYHICDLMAKITVDDVSKEIEEKGYVTIHDPCCGAGATLIAGVHEVRRQLEKNES